MYTRPCRWPSAAPHPGDVHLADHMFSSLDVFGGPGDEDAFALAASVGFTDVRLVLLGPDIRLEVAEAVEHDSRIGRWNNDQMEGKINMTSVGKNRLSREAPGSREDVVVSGEELKHPVHVPGQRVFAADLAHPWEVVDFLQRT